MKLPPMIVWSFSAAAIAALGQDRDSRRLVELALHSEYSTEWENCGLMSTPRPARVVHEWSEDTAWTACWPDGHVVHRLRPAAAAAAPSSP